MFGLRVKEKQITFDNYSVANMFQRLFSTWHASTFPPFFYVFNLILYFFLLYRHECFTGKYTTRKIHKNYIQDPSGLFSIISQVSLSMT